MADLHISEFSGLGATDPGDSLQISSPDAHITDQVIVLSASPASSAAFNAQTRFVRVIAGGPAAIAVGVGPQTAAVGGWFLNTGQEIWLRVPAGKSYLISAVTDTL
jgi:hypothetical protein